MSSLLSLEPPGSAESQADDDCVTFRIAGKHVSTKTPVVKRTRAGGHRTAGFSVFSDEAESSDEAPAAAPEAPAVAEAPAAAPEETA